MSVKKGIGLGFGGTIGHWFAKAGAKTLGVIALTGAVRTGAVEIGEATGVIPEDKYDNILQSYGHYTLQNLVDAKDAAVWVWDATKDSNTPSGP